MFNVTSSLKIKSSLRESSHTPNSTRHPIGWYRFITSAGVRSAIDTPVELILRQDNYHTPSATQLTLTQLTPVYCPHASPRYSGTSSGHPTCHVNPQLCNTLPKLVQWVTGLAGSPWPQIIAAKWEDSSDQFPGGIHLTLFVRSCLLSFISRSLFCFCYCHWGQGNPLLLTDILDSRIIRLILWFFTLFSRLICWFFSNCFHVKIMLLLSYIIVNIFFSHKYGLANMFK